MVKEQQKPSVIRSAAMMSAGTMLSRLFGFVRDALIFALFSRTITDAYAVAFRLPNLFRRLFGEGSLSVAFIPVFVEQLNQSADHARAKRLANGVFTLLLVVTLLVFTMGFILMEPIIEFLVGNKAGYASVPGKMEQTIYFARLMMFYVVLVTIYAYFMAIANALKKFFIPALAPAAFNLCAIIFSLLPPDWGRLPGETLCWGVLVGGSAQLAMVTVLLIREGYLPKFTLQIQAPGIKTVLTNMGPGLLGLGVFQIVTLVNTWLAARLPEGAQSYLYAADRVLELPQSLIAISLGSALLPTFSEQLVRGQKAELLQSANHAMRVLLYLSLPSAVGMFVLALPISQVLFMRGVFSLSDAINTADVVKAYSLLLLFTSISKVTLPAFYAAKNTWLPALIAMICLVIHIFVGQIFVNNFGLFGLASATALLGFLNMLMLQICFQMWMGSLSYRLLLFSVGKLLLPLVFMGLFCHYGYNGLIGLVAPQAPSSTHRALALGVTIGASMVFYFWSTLRLGIPEAQQVVGRLAQRFGQRKSA